VEVRALRKSYGDVEAVAGIDLRVAVGEVYALLGPNGAGKTTTIEILEGFRARDGGQVKVLGTDPSRPTPDWRARVGLVLQTSAMPAELTVRELVDRYAGYFPHPRSVEETIERVGLSGRERTRAGKLSGGQQRRLDVALALVGDPDLLFLDEPTTGFDPAARRQAWHLVEDLRSLGKTVLLTTHYMDEAEHLADRVAIIVAGRVVAEGPPQTLGGRDRESTEIRFRTPPDFDPRAVTGLPARRDHDTIVIATTDPLPTLGALDDWARTHRTQLVGLEVRRKTLEDIYLTLTEAAR
jgi:ABC-2 type transport system ATP-binding protein